MPEFEMPVGKYLSLSGQVTTSNGGQMRALLMRNRILARYAGLTPIIVTFDQEPVYPEIRDELRRQGELIEPVRLLNIYEHYRATSIDHHTPLDRGLDEMIGFKVEEDLHPDGTVYRRAYAHPRNGKRTAIDYLRPDGSIFLRAPASKYVAAAYQLINSLGQPVRSWAERSGWWRLWLNELCPGDESVFVISDCRFTMTELIPMRSRRFHLIHLNHNAHTTGARAWNSSLSASYVKIIDSVSALDGFVTLTNRQSEDVGLRCGFTDNRYVVSNPVEMPTQPSELPRRERRSFVIVGRLEAQKRLDHAIEAFALVVAQDPEARLDIFGDGALRVPLQRQIDKLGLNGSVLLRGYDPNAREVLSTATAFLMTSAFEGYPLATLESMSRGCPVISYDINYGPREQITPGSDGYLLAFGDINGLASRCLELIADPELVQRMSKSAREKAASHSEVAFLQDWKGVIQSCVAKKPFRTTLESVNLIVSQFGYVRASRLPERLARPRSSSGAFRTSRRVEFVGKLDVRVRTKKGRLDSAVVTLDAVCESTGAIASIPVHVTLGKRTFLMSASFDIGEVFAALGTESDSAYLRLRLVWNNSSWQTHLNRPDEMRPNYEISFTDRGDLHLHRGQGAPR